MTHGESGLVPALTRFESWPPARARTDDDTDDTAIMRLGYTERGRLVGAERVPVELFSVLLVVSIQPRDIQ